MDVLIGFGCFLLVFGGICLIGTAWAKPKKSVQRRIWFFSVWVVAGTSFVILGSLGVRFTRNAAILHGIGTVANFRASRGCTSYVIRMDPPLKEELLKRVCYDVFTLGTRVDVIYQEGSKDVLEITDLDGAHAGRHLTESSDLPSYKLLLDLGYALLGIGLVYLLISTVCAMWRSRQLSG